MRLMCRLSDPVNRKLGSATLLRCQCQCGDGRSPPRGRYTKGVWCAEDLLANVCGWPAHPRSAVTPCRSSRAPSFRAADSPLTGPPQRFQDHDPTYRCLTQLRTSILGVSRHRHYSNEAEERILQEQSTGAEHRYCHIDRGTCARPTGDSQVLRQDSSVDLSRPPIRAWSGSRTRRRERRRQIKPGQDPQRHNSAGLGLHRIER